MVTLREIVSQLREEMSFNVKQPAPGVKTSPAPTVKKPPAVAKAGPEPSKGGEPSPTDKEDEKLDRERRALHKDAYKGLKSAKNVKMYRAAGGALVGIHKLIQPLDTGR